MRGDAGRAQGVERAAADGGGDDKVGDLRHPGHHAVGALRLKPLYTDRVLVLFCFLGLFVPGRSVLVPCSLPIIYFVIAVSW